MKNPLRLITHKPLKVGFVQRKNLKALATYLETLNTEESPVKFDMREFECETAACAVGFGPLAGIQKFSFEDWYSYADRAFGACPFFGPDMRRGPVRAFEYMFGSQWEKHDNTPEGAARRIREFLKHGIPRWGWRSK
jgi:hypothetical protein